MGGKSEFKKLLILTTLLVSLNCFSQTFKAYEIKKLNSFGINLDSIDLSNNVSQMDFNAILNKDKKMQKNKTTGIILTSISVLSTSFGILILSRKSANGEGKAFNQIFGGLFIGSGVINAGISISLFNSSKKRKKERNALIKIYNDGKIEKKLLSTKN